METTLLSSAIFIIASLLLTNLFIHWFSKISLSIGMVDQPNQRKIHQQAIPIVGGISMILAWSIAMIFNPLAQQTVINYALPFAAVALVFIMSLFDDKLDLSAKLRLAIQITAAILVAYSGVRIPSLFGLFGIYHIPIEAQYLLTVIVLVGSMNAFNLIDGVDGLAGTLALLSIGLLAVIAFALGQTGIFLLCLGLVATLLAFLKHNRYPAKIFMGDAGSMTLGFLITLISIILLQIGESSTSSSLIFILIACALMVPVIDALRVFLKRYAKGYSILAADKSHIHHLLLSDKKSHKKVVKRIVALQISLLVLGVFLSTISSISFTIVSLVLVQIVISKILLANKTLAEWQLQLRNNEKFVQL